jgi:hypothetical protein
MLEFCQTVDADLKGYDPDAVGILIPLTYPPTDGYL